ncbi:MAG: xylulose kinase [Demequinaceae bacterium]|nr:xylulose kinase [Demequinaceae bacterium]
MPLVAGVDSSTQSCKVVIRDADSGRVVRAGRARHPDGTEVDPAHWWMALREALEDAGGLGDVDAISIGGQQHGMVVLDGGGRVIRDALLWNDTRSATAAEDLTQEFGADALAARTGLVPVASFTSTKLRWLRYAEPDNAARVAAVALPHDWLTWRLRGFGPEGDSPLGPDLEELATDRSDASGTGYFSPSSGEYDREILIAALGHDAVLPRIVGPSEAIGTGAAGVPDSIPGIVIGPGCGDNAGAALGLGAAGGDVALSIGTSGTVFAVSNEPVIDPSGTVAGFADASGLFLPLVATLNAARVLDAFTRILGVDHDELGRLALSAPVGSSPVLVPFFEGERTPNLPDATATLVGLTLGNFTPTTLARAACEGMLCGVGAGLVALTDLGVAVERVLLIGGAAQSEAVQSIAAQVVDASIEVPIPGEYVALGAAVQAGWALTGKRPAWPVEMSARPAPDFRAEIRERYDSAVAAFYG